MRIILRTLFYFSFLSAAVAVATPAQTFQPRQDTDQTRTVAVKPSAAASEMDEIKRQLREQQKEIQQLRLMLEEQNKLIKNLLTAGQQPVLNSPAAVQNPPAAAVPPTVPVPTPTDAVETRLGKIEEQVKRSSDAIARNQLGTLGFSGELRVQYDAQYGLTNNAPNINNPAILGNELSSRQRLRYRLRLAVRGKMGGDVFTGAYTAGGEKRTDKEFEWGLRFSSGSLSNPVSSNAVLTDFFTRKPIGIDQAFVAWRPRPLPGLRLVAGKFEPTWTRTEMTIDNDVQVEGLSQIYSRDIKHSVLRNITFSAWQLPMLERGTTFVRNPNGTINLVESRRAGRDLALYGAQLQTRLTLAPDTSLTLAAADLYFANTDAITPIQVFGSNLQLPVTITIPPTGTTPGQVVTGVVNIPREFLVTGNGNLGLSVATNAATNRDGRLASGFNLVDLLAQLELRQYRHAPVTMILDYVRNTRTRDVVVAGPAGGNLALPNNENQGFWAEIRFQSLRRKRGSDFSAPVKGDWLASYTFLRIEKDAVLTPFNWDDLIQQSDVRGHRLFFSYFADPRVTFNITGLFSRRANNLLGPFVPTPPGSLDRGVTRIQIDTVFRF